MILLDSHIFYWLIAERPEFGKGARAFVESSKRVFVSALSILELQGKMQKNRLPKFDFVEMAEVSNLTHLPFTAQDAQAIRDLPALQNHDPIDVALLAQARNNRLDFLTADRKLLALELPWVIDARV